MLAARSVARDFGKVMHWIPDIDSVASAGMTNIRVVDAAVAGERGIRSLDGFESHRIYVDGDDIVLAGKDMRGAIYALYSFSEKFLGVPPLWYLSCGWRQCCGLS